MWELGLLRKGVDARSLFRSGVRALSCGAYMSMLRLLGVDRDNDMANRRGKL